MVDKYKFFKVEGTIVGWVHIGDEEDVSIMENDVAIVQTDEGVCYLRWLGNDWEQIDPPMDSSDQLAAIGARISFDTNLSEQMEYSRLAKGEDGTK